MILKVVLLLRLLGHFVWVVIDVQNVRQNVNTGVDCMRIWLFLFDRSFLLFHLTFILLSVFKISDVKNGSSKIQNTKLDQQMMIKRFLTDNFQQYQDTGHWVHWCISNLWEYFLILCMGMVINSKIRATQVWQNRVCLIVVNCKVCEYFC